MIATVRLAVSRGTPMNSTSVLPLSCSGERGAVVSLATAGKLGASR